MSQKEEKGFHGDLLVKSPLANAGDKGLIPGLGRSPGRGNSNPLQYPCLGNLMDRGAWRATVHGVEQSDMTKRLNKRREGEVGGKLTECEVMDTKRGKSSRVSGHMMQLSTWVKAQNLLLD